jgi:nucleoside-diphosphate-sugar epimerase
LEVGKNMNILVTGGAGYIGSVLTRLLLTEGHKVTILDSFMYGDESLSDIRKNPQLKIVRSDIRDAGKVSEALKGADAVVHLCAIVGDPACARNPDLAREVNINASLQLYKMCQQRGISRFVFASTCSNYGRMKDPTQYVDEESELQPVSLYAECKVSVEKALLEAPADSKPLVTILRFATAFGLSPRMRFDLTVNEFTMELLTKKKVTIFGEQFWRPYAHTQDISRAIAMVLAAPPEKVKGKVFNTGDTGQNYQKGQLVKMVSSKLPFKTEIVRIQKVEDPRDYRVSFEKIKKELGFHIIHTVDDGIQEIIDAISRKEYTDFDNPRYKN